MTGKQKCKILKQIRQQIATENDIPYVVSECPYQGNCQGTCPQCEKELRDLEKALLKRKIGTAVAVTGVSIALLAAAEDYIKDKFNEINNQSTGGVVAEINVNTPYEDNQLQTGNDDILIL